jgi:hypothetical protein
MRRELLTLLLVATGRRRLRHFALVARRRSRLVIRFFRRWFPVIVNREFGY